MRRANSRGGGSLAHGCLPLLFALAAQPFLVVTATRSETSLRVEVPPITDSPGVHARTKTFTRPPFRNFTDAPLRTSTASPTTWKPAAVVISLVAITRKLA
jgi:hypothetical protein